MTTNAARVPLDLEEGAAYDAVLAEIKWYATSEGTYALPYVSVLFCALPAVLVWLALSH